MLILLNSAAPIQLATRHAALINCSQFYASPLPDAVSVSASDVVAAGPYCNHYFLKRLAAIGRGMNDVAFRPHAIQSVMDRILAAAALPMLSDVQIRVQVGTMRVHRRDVTGGHALDLQLLLDTRFRSCFACF